MAVKSGTSSLLYAVLHRCNSSRITIVWTITVFMCLALVMRGFVEQFCEDCRQEDSRRGKPLTRSGGSIQLRNENEPSITSFSNSCLTVNFAPKGSQELVALPSYPGSGNTWLRHLLESSTGIYTGSVYKDKKIFAAGFRGEQADYTKRIVLGVKMHRCSRKEIRKFPAIIFLVRNPYNAMISEWHRYHTSKHVQVAGPETFQTKAWQEFVEEESSHWERMLTNCIYDTPRTLVVFYENLQNNLASELIRIHRFLRKPIDADRLQCTLHNTEGQFHRSTHIDFDPYTPEMVSKINKRIETGAAKLEECAGLKFPVDYRKISKTKS